MPVSDRISVVVVPTGSVAQREWEEIWLLTAEFFDAER